jgi:hypothetical protein
MKIDDMKAGYERDKGAYALAAAFNSSILVSQNKRRLYEEEQLYGGEQGPEAVTGIVVMETNVTNGERGTSYGRLA